MEINLYAECYEGKELSYASIEAVAVYDNAMLTFRHFMNAANEILYAEADEATVASSDGFFKKVLNFFKRLLNQIVEFIKRVARKTIEILTKPFGTKMKAANSAGSTGSSSGGGSTVSADSGTQTSNPMTMKFANLVELANLQKSIIKYILTGNKPITWDYIKSSGMNFKQLDSASIYQEAHFTRELNNMETIGKRVVTAASSVALMDKGVSNVLSNDEFIKALDVKNHESMGTKFEVVSGNDGMLVRTVQLFMTLGPLVEDLITECGRISNRADKLSEKKSASAKEIQDAINVTLNIEADKKLSNVISKADKIEKSIIFGKPAVEMLKMRRLAILCAGGDTTVKTISSQDLAKYLKANGRSEYNFKSASEYAKTLTEGQIVDTSVMSKLFKDQSIASGSLFVDILAENFTVPNVDNYLTLLKESVDKLAQINTDNFTTDADGKSGAQGIEDKFEKGLTAKGATDAWKSLLTGCSKIVKNLGNQTITLCQDVRQLYSNLEGAKYIQGSMYLGNWALYNWDYFNYGLQSLEKLLEDKAFTDKVFDGSEEKIKKAKFDIKKLKEDLVREIKDELGVKSVD